MFSPNTLAAVDPPAEAAASEIWMSGIIGPRPDAAIREKSLVSPMIWRKRELHHAASV
jgi:hypothetical protein